MRISDRSQIVLQIQVTLYSTATECLAMSPSILCARLRPFCLLAERVAWAERVPCTAKDFVGLFKSCVYRLAINEFSFNSAGLGDDTHKRRSPV